MKKLALIATSLLVSSLASADVKGVSCIGTEPFFNLQVSVETGLMTYVGVESSMTTPVTGPINAEGMPEAAVMVFKGTKSDVNVTVIESAIAGVCTDGMSDNTYSYHLVYTNGDTVNYGCCEPIAQD